MNNRLVFDTTDFATINDSHDVGAYVRSDHSGALITHHTPIESGTVTFDFVDGDVTVGTNTIAETAHGLLTGEVVQLTTTGTLPTGLALATDYYVIRVDADNFKLAATKKDAEQGIAVDITAAAGGGTHTVTEQDRDRRALDVWVMNQKLDVEVINAADIEVAVNSEYAEDSAHSSGDIGSYVLAVRQDTLAASTDADGDYASFKVNANGELYVKDTDVLAQLVTIDSVLDSIKVDTGVIAGDTTSIDATLTALSKAEDSAHSSGDQGIQSLSVRIDDLDAAPVGTLAGTEGDYQSLHTTSRGALWVKHDGDLTVNDAALANTAIAHFQQAAGADDTAESTVDSILTNRKYLFLANKGNKVMAIGGAGVTIATGFPIYPGSYVTLRAGASIDVQWAARTAVGSDLRALELS